MSAVSRAVNGVVALRAGNGRVRGVAEFRVPAPSAPGITGGVTFGEPSGDVFTSWQ